VLGGIAVAHASRRDAGGAVFAANESHHVHPIGLGSPARLAARIAAPVTVAWAVGILRTAFGAVTHSMSRATSGTSDLLSRLGGTRHGSYAFLAVAFVLLGTILAPVPAHHIAVARDEERSGHLALLLAGPVRRNRWFAGRIALGPLAGIMCRIGAALLRGRRRALGPDRSGSRLVPLALVALSVGDLVFPVAPRIAPASVEIVVGWSLVIDLLGSLVSGLKPLTRLSLFHHAGRALTAGADRQAFAVTTAVALALSASAVAVFERRSLSLG
jgi:ABC-2 type transport system permease protein